MTMPIKARTLRDVSLRIWEHVLNMDVESPDDIKTGAPLIPVLNNELKSFMAGIVAHCADIAVKADSPFDARERLDNYARYIRDTPARKVEIPQPDEQGIESLEPEQVAKIVDIAKEGDCGCDPEAEPT